MTDAEYASQIYRAVFDLSTDEGDAYVRGVFTVFAALPEQERLALEYRYRGQMTYQQMSELMGNISIYRVQQILRAALSQLRRPDNIQKIRVSQIIARCDLLQELLQETDHMYHELHQHMEDFFKREDKKQALRRKLEHKRILIENMGVSVYISNALARANILDSDSLLAVRHLNELKKFRCLGQQSIQKIIHVMREFGFTEWADKMEEEMQSAKKQPATRQP